MGQDGGEKKERKKAEEKSGHYNLQLNSNAMRSCENRTMSECYKFTTSPPPAQPSSPHSNAEEFLQEEQKINIMIRKARGRKKAKNKCKQTWSYTGTESATKGFTLASL